VSTTYVGGVSRRPIPEELHTAVPQSNTYLVTKWGAEMALHVEAAGAPLLVYRPPGVVGDSRTGWYGGKAFGSYNFYDGVRVGAATGASSFVWDIDPQIVHPYLPIDAFTAHAAALVEHAPVLDGTTVVHDLGSWASNEQLSAIAGEVYGVRVGFGTPTTEVDRAVDAVIAPNKPFNQPGFAYPYREGRLAELLGDHYTRHPLDEAAIRRIVAFFRENPPTDSAA
jgi:nucleoside-diphosphate-sugar epimerase